MRVDDPPPGIELQVDFGRLGLVPDGDKRRVCQGLIFTACFSRHQFVWPTFSQTTEEVISGFEAAWGYFGGVFPVVIPDNMKSIVIEAENTAPRFNDTFMEYAQSRGFVIDAARVRDADRQAHESSGPSNTCRRTSSPARVSSTSPTARVRAETWCTETAGMRIHGTTQCRPIEVFRTEEQPLLLAPAVRAVRHAQRGPSPRCTGTSTVEVAKAIYSVHHHLVGRTPQGQARLDHA